MKKIGLFIDGSNTYATAMALKIDIDYKKLHDSFGEELVRAYYYTAVIPDQESNIIPLLDWLSYNKYSVVRKPTKEFTDPLTGRKKIKGNMDIEIAVDVMELGTLLTDVVLFSGDGDFTHLVHALKRQGIKVTAVSSIVTQPAMIADELRRAVDNFIDLSAWPAIHAERRSGMKYA